MNRKPGIMTILLFLTGLLCISSLLFFSYNTYQHIVTTGKDLDNAMEIITDKQAEIKDAEEKYTAAADQKETNIKRMKQKARNTSQTQAKERAEVAESSSKPSVFDETADAESFTSETGHVVAIDPGHQSESVDMSALEPNGPGSSEMKAKCTTGTTGSYSGVPEYELNLEVSMKLKAVLEARGYQVVMTRTDNETAISNKERAQYAAAQGAEIYVRIHANGVDNSSTSGALTMSPSASNPYVSQLYDESNRLSRCILDSYCAATGFASLGVQYYDNMTGINWSTVPVTILEMGFMTNQQDDLKMTDTSFQDTMAQGIADGIDSYFS